MSEIDSAAPESALRSSFFEQLVEHVFISEVLQEAWYRHRMTVEVLRSEVDASGYDLVLECNGVLRHVQLKTTTETAKAGYQKVNIALAQKPGGCVIWLFRREDPVSGRMRLEYRYFGGPAGHPLPAISDFRVARHTKGDGTGVKRERPAIREIPRGRFERLTGVGELLSRLFGLDPR